MLSIFKSFRISNPAVNKQEQKHSRYLRLAMAPLVLLLIYVLIYLINPYSPSWKDYKNAHYISLIIETVSGLALSWIIIEISTGIAYWLEYRFPWTSSPLLRFFLQTILIIISLVILLFLQDRAFTWMFGEMNSTQQENLDVWQFFIVSIIVSILVSAVHTGSFLLSRWKTSMSEAAELRVKTMELKEVAMHAELQSLKLQLDPHFMFNNFSTLSELINEDSVTAAEFLDNLSRVYRYMIQNIKKDLVQLKDEVTFVKAYFYLMQIRHGDHIQMELELNETALQLAIPPITLQLLIENAIKHNMATAGSPLRIRITFSAERIIVTNNLQLIPHPLPAMGMGLENITNRYRILSGNLPEVQETAESFTVRLPLLDF